MNAMIHIVPASVARIGELPPMPNTDTRSPEQRDADTADYRRSITEYITAESAWPGERWYATWDDDTEAGYYISERGKPHVPIAFVPHGRGVREGDWATELSTSVMEFPDTLYDHPGGDLRPYARIDSERPTPAYLYRLRIRREGDDPRHAFPLAPFCPFRLARLVAQFNGMKFSTEERAKHPIDTVGIEGRDGDGLTADVGLVADDVDIW